MATNYTCTNYTGPDRKNYLILKTSASNIRLVSNFKNGTCDTVRASGFYGMNASFFNSNTNKAILNIAFQNGASVGTGQSVPSPNGGTAKDGTVNLIGDSVVFWNGSALNCLNGILYSSNANIPKSPNTWAQGGIGLYLCNNAWKARYMAEYSAEAYPLDEVDARTGILINKSTRSVYLFACTSAIYVSNLRDAMMAYAGLTEGGSAGNWVAIMTDGGRSTQLYTAENSTAALRARGVPQIIALKNKN